MRQDRRRGARRLRVDQRMAKAGVKLDQTRHRRALGRVREVPAVEGQEPAPLPGPARRRPRRERPQLRRQGHRQAEGARRPPTTSTPEGPGQLVAAHVRPDHQRAAVHEGRQAAHPRAAHADQDSTLERERRGSRSSRWPRPPSRSSSRPSTAGPRLREGRRGLQGQDEPRPSSPTRSRSSSRPAGRDAILAALPSADTDTTRRASRRRSCSSRRTRASSRRSSPRTSKSPGTRRSTLLGALKPRAALAQASANFYDPTMTDWLLKEIERRPTPRAMPAARGRGQADAPCEEGRRRRGAGKLKKELPADGFAARPSRCSTTPSQALDKCRHGRELLRRHPRRAHPRRRRPRPITRPVKAAWMAVIYGEAAPTRRAPSCCKRRQGQGRGRAPRAGRGHRRARPQGRRRRRPTRSTRSSRPTPRPATRTSSWPTTRSCRSRCGCGRGQLPRASRPS